MKYLEFRESEMIEKFCYFKIWHSAKASFVQQIYSKMLTHEERKRKKAVKVRETKSLEHGD